MTIQPGWGEQWETLANAITDYYGGGIESTQYQQVVSMLNSGNYTMEEMDAIIGNIPEFSRTYNSAGQLTNVTYNVSKSTATSAAGSVAQQVNSNVANATKTQFGNVQTITTNPQTGTVTISDNIVKYKTGQLAPTTIKGVAGSAIAAVCAASVGITAAKTVEGALYNLAPDFWEDHNLGSINPETWKEITAGDDSFQARLFNMVFGIDEVTKNPQPYISQEAYAYMIAYMASKGVFSVGEEQSTIDGSSLFNPNYQPNPMQLTPSTVVIESFPDEFGNHSKQTVTLPSGVKAFGLVDPDHPNIGYFTPIATQPTTLTVERYNFVTGTTTYQYLNLNNPITTKSGNTYYQGSFIPFTPIEEYGYNFVLNGGEWGEQYFYEDSATVMFEGTISTVDGIPGITSQPGGRQFDASGISDYSDINAVLQALQAQYPELWENRIEFSPDGSTTHVYVPVGFPTGGTGTQPTTIGASQTDTAPDISGKGDNATDELIKTLIEAITHPGTATGMESDTDTPVKPIDPNADPRGTGENPPIVPPAGSASALWKIYNPSQSQLDTFGAWLWSSDFVDQLLKLFNDPMQAIIGLHKVFCNPPVSGSGPIKVGYLVSDASANYVSNQYTEIDCGDVDLKEKFGNVFDYDGFTRLSVFLPFIGFRDLDTKDVMRGKINIKYGIDVLTGACLAKIKITRDLNSPILYTFEGNCAVQYPVSSGSYIGIITGACALIGGVAGTIASGGALGAVVPALVGATAGLGSMHANVQHSGNVSSNAGALGPKKPYLVIQRPQTQMPQNGILIEGEGQNENVLLGSLTGFVRIKKADYNGIPGTSNELNEIRELLENGIYMT